MIEIKYTFIKRSIGYALKKQFGLVGAYTSTLFTRQSGFHSRSVLPAVVCGSPSVAMSSPSVLCAKSAAVGVVLGVAVVVVGLLCVAVVGLCVVVVGLGVVGLADSETK